MRHVIPLLAFLLLSSLVSAESSVADEGSLPLTDLVRQVKVALLQVAEATEAQRLPKLDSAVLEVKTSMKPEVTGQLSLWVVELGGSANNEYASTVTLTLKPPPPGSPSNIAAASLSDALREAILAGARAVKTAGEGNPPLLAEKLEASVRFAIQRDGSGKISVKFPPFSVSAGAKVATGQVHTITVIYKR